MLQAEVVELVFQGLAEEAGVAVLAPLDLAVGLPGGVACGFEPMEQALGLQVAAAVPVALELGLAQAAVVPISLVAAVVVPTPQHLLALPAVLA